MYLLGWKAHGLLFFIFWTIVDFSNSLNLLQNDIPLMKGENYIYPKYKDKLLECSYRLY